MTPVLIGKGLLSGGLTFKNRFQMGSRNTYNTLLLSSVSKKVPVEIPGRFTPEAHLECAQVTIPSRVRIIKFLEHVTMLQAMRNLRFFRAWADASFRVFHRFEPMDKTNGSIFLVSENKCPDKQEFFHPTWNAKSPIF